MRRANIGAALVAWYRQNKRTLPWRYGARKPDPYKVWVSEIMLQQTTVAGVMPRFERFLKQFPTLQALAEAEQSQVLDAWAGLGYYARARNMHLCAQQIIRQYNGRFPEDEKALLKLAGIGDYTAAALMTIAFNQKAVALDGNGKRVLARLFAEAAPVKSMMKKLKKHYADIFDDTAPAEFAQAMMDLGATICTPNSPKCEACPLQKFCKGKNRWEKIPHRVNKSALPVRYGVLLYIGNSKGEVLLRRRLPKAMLGGCIEFIGTAWDNKLNEKQENLYRQDLHALQKTLQVKDSAWEILQAEISHTFTHYKLQLRLYRLIDDAVFARATRHIDNHFIAKVNDLTALPFPTLMKKAMWEFTR